MLQFEYNKLGIFFDVGPHIFEVRKWTSGRVLACEEQLRTESLFRFFF